MRVNIYHINKARDINGKLYSVYQNGDVVDPSIYDEVFSAELDTTNLEEIHRMMKFEGHPLMRAANLTVSDVVVVNGRAHICQPRGFEEIDFDVSKTQKPDNLMRVVYVEPYKPAYVADVEHTLEAEQKAVGGGVIQTLYFEDDNTTIIAMTSRSSWVCPVTEGSVTVQQSLPDLFSLSELPVMTLDH